MRPGGGTATAEIYSVAAGTWTSAASMSSSRTNHSATLLSSGRVLVAGGSLGGTSYASTEIFDPAGGGAGSWAAGPSLGGARDSHYNDINCAACAGGSCNPITGLCTTDPCCGVTFDTPPATGCYASTGTCAAGACSYPTLPDGSSCADGDVCNGDEVCRGGACAAGIPLPCDDDNPCTGDNCDAVDGCISGPLPDGTTCSTATTCNGSCASGVCTGGIPIDCEDDNPCTTDGCDEATGACTNDPRTGSPCDDGNACTADDSCRDDGSCGGEDVSCDDDEPCTDDSCDPATGCAHEVSPDGTVCDDGDACTADHACFSGDCTGGSTVSCDDDNPCTDDTCDPATGCANAAMPGLSCDDGDQSTGNDACLDDGTCAGTPMPAGGGCGCRAVGHASSRAAPASLVVAVLAILAMGRSRRRWSPEHRRGSVSPGERGR